MEQRGAEAARAEADGGIHSGEHYLTKTLGEDIDGRLHRPQLLARRITFRGHIPRMLAALIMLRGTLLDLAEQHRETPQHAQPTTFAHWRTMSRRSLPATRS